MIYNIISISIKKFVIIWISWLIFFILLFIVLVTNIDTKISFLFFAIGFITIFISGLLISLKYSKKLTIITIIQNKIAFDDFCIELLDIQGYYINREGQVMTQIEFRAKNKDYKITSTNHGQNGKDFELFLSDFVKKSKELNSEFQELSFYDFHHKQYSFAKRSIYIDLGFMILLNLIYLYLIVFKNVAFNWKLLFLNFIFMGFYDFHKKNDKKFKKQ